MNRVLYQPEPRGPSELVEIEVLTNGQQRVKFPDVQQLRSTTNQKIILKAIRVITDEVLTNAMLSVNANAPIAELQKIALVIYCEGWEKGHLIPILTLNDMHTEGGAAPHRYAQTNFNDWQNVSWDKCYLQFGNGTVSANAPYTVLLDVQYEKYNNEGAVIIGPS